MKDMNTIGHRIRILQNHIHNQMEYHKEKNEDELTRMQRFTIGFLAHNQDKELYQKDIEVKFSISRATASNMLAVMERKGLICRESVEHDARLKKLKLTEKSEQMLRRIDQDIKETESLLTKGMTEDDKQRLDKYLDLMIQNMVGATEEHTTICGEKAKNDTRKN